MSWELQDRHLWIGFGMLNLKSILLAILGANST